MNNGGLRYNNTGLVISLIAVLFYVSAVLVLRQPKISEYWDELTSIGAAISHVVLDAPVGFIDEGIQSALISSGTPIRDVIAGVRSGEIKPSATLKVSQDGNGIGYVLFAT